MNDPSKNIQQITFRERADVAKKEAELQSRGFMYVDGVSAQSLLVFEYTIIEERPETVFDTDASFTVRWRED